MRSSCLILFGIVSGGMPALGAISSTFTDSDEQWSFLNDATGFGFDASLGQPAGAITARDRGDGRIWYFAAGPQFLGDRSAFLNGSLSWDILGITGNQTSITPRADVMLTGAGMTIGIDASVQPINGSWTSWGVTLAPGQWFVVSSTANGTLSSTAVSQADLAMVLGALDGLFIRGEYTNGADATALDNVLLVPAPAALPMLAMGAFALRRRR